jgi:transposase
MITDQELAAEDPRVLVALLRRFEVEVRRLSTLNEKLANEKALKAQLEFDMNHQLSVLRKIIFGRKSEKRRPEASDRPRENQDLLLQSESLIPPPKESAIEDLPTEEVHFQMSSEELLEESLLRGISKPSAENWEAVDGLFESSTQVHVTERTYIKQKIKRQKYKLKKEFNESEKQVIIVAPGPDKILPGSTYSLDFALSVVADKYISHMPLERQCKEMHSLGLRGMKPKTLYNLVAAGAICLEEIPEKIRQEMILANVGMNMDETPWPIQLKDQDDGYMWVMSNCVGGVYSFEPSRSGKIAKAMLEGYTGPVMCDRFTGYNRLREIGGVELAHCWAHVRREFIRIEENYPDISKLIIDQIAKLFKIERRAQSFDELKKLRSDESSKVVEQIRELLFDAASQARMESALKKAVEYTTKVTRS